MVEGMFWDYLSAVPCLHRCNHVNFQPPPAYYHLSKDSELLGFLAIRSSALHLGIVLHLSKKYKSL